MAAADKISGELARVGIKAEVRPLPAATFYATDVGSPNNVTANGFGIVLATWTADFPTPASFLTPLVDGRSIRNAHAGGGTAAWRKVAGTVDKASVYVPLGETRIQLLAGQRLRNGVVMQPYSGHVVATAGVR